VGLLTRIGRLEGQVELLMRLITVQQPARAAAIPVATEPLVPEKVRKAINDQARGNRTLERHLTKVALELVSQQIEEDVIAKRIREGDRVD
jgi:hypothetical protein